jgi:copper transport protein
VKTSPAAVRLTFSESVEVEFGAVRVFDVNGHRVDKGDVTRSGGNRIVSVSVPELKDGTYTVTWRVVSADGHPVHGGFVFYVGAPSSISAVAVAGDTGVSTAVTWTYGLVRFLWFFALFGIVGLVAVRVFVWTPAVRAAGLGDEPAGQWFRRRFRPALLLAWSMLALTGVAWLFFQSASVSGLPFTEAIEPSVLNEVLRTTFGHVWLAQMAMTVLLALPVAALISDHLVLGLSPRVWLVLLAVLVTVLCLVVPWNGHARTDSRPWLDVVSLAAHLLAVGVWVGGLGALVVVARPAWKRAPDDGRPALVSDIVRGFGRVAVIAVVVVLVTGTVNSFANLSSFSDLWRTSYGRVLCLKIALLELALVLAAFHRWIVPPRLRTPGEGTKAVRTFQRSAVAEVLVLGAAVALAAGLVAMVPGRSLALAARGPVNKEAHVGRYTVQLFLDPSKPGQNQVHLTFVDAQGLAAAAVTNTSLQLGPTGGKPATVAMRLLAPGHFAGDADLPSAGPYTARVTVGDTGGPATTIDFKLSKP